MTNFSWVEFWWAAFAAWGFIRGFQLAGRYVRRRRLLSESGVNGILQVTALLGVGRAVSAATVEGFFLFTGILAALTPPRIPQPFQILNFIATYGILLGAFLMAAWQEVELRLDSAILAVQEQEMLRITRSEQTANIDERQAQVEERQAQSDERDAQSQYRRDNPKP